jgi:hypothetical protein
LKIFLLILFWSGVFAFSIESSYEVAHKKALQEDKFLMVFVTKKGFNMSSSELQKLMRNKAIDELIEKKAVFVIVYKEQGESYPIEMLYTQSIPRLFVLDANELFVCEGLYLPLSEEALRTCMH